jgi:hypothetical protein
VRSISQEPCYSFTIEVESSIRYLHCGGRDRTREMREWQDYPMGIASSPRVRRRCFSGRATFAAKPRPQRNSRRELSERQSKPSTTTSDIHPPTHRCHEVYEFPCLMVIWLWNADGCVCAVLKVGRVVIITRGRKFFSPRNIGWEGRMLTVGTGYAGKKVRIQFSSLCRTPSVARTMVGKLGWREQDHQSHGI